MISISPYLNFMGKTEEAMNFYRSVFGGEFTAMQRFRESPGYEKMPKHEHDLIMHACLPLPGGHLLMATDALESMHQSITIGNNVYICIHAESEDETNRIFKDLSTGGKIEMPLNLTFWGAYFGICRDRFGVQWMVNYDASKLPESAVRKRNNKTKN